MNAGLLAPDTPLRDSGRYRLRRHGGFIVDDTDTDVAVSPHRVHWQPTEYNALRRCIERWFEPLETALVAEPLWPVLLRWLAARVSALRGVQACFVEAHPLRSHRTPLG